MGGYLHCHTQPMEFGVFIKEKQNAVTKRRGGGNCRGRNKSTCGDSWLAFTLETSSHATTDATSLRGESCCSPY